MERSLDRLNESKSGEATGDATAELEGEVTCDVSELRERGCEMSASRWPVVGGEVMLDASVPFDRGVLAMAVTQGEDAVCSSVGEVMAVPWLWLLVSLLMVALANAHARSLSDADVSVVGGTEVSPVPSSKQVSSSSGPAIPNDPGRTDGADESMPGVSGMHLDDWSPAMASTNTSSSLSLSLSSSFAPTPALGRVLSVS